VSRYIGELLSHSSLSPLFLGWLIATILRVCVGSATVAGITTAGIILPLVTNSNVNRELMVLAIGSGSLMLAHVNDGGFWLVKEYFNLSIKDTIKTWTMMETAVGVAGPLASSCSATLYSRGKGKGQGPGCHQRAPRTKPIGVSLQNASQGPKSTWGDEVWPRVPPTAPGDAFCRLV